MNKPLLLLAGCLLVATGGLAGAAGVSLLDHPGEHAASASNGGFRLADDDRRHREKHDDHARRHHDDDEDDDDGGARLPAAGPTDPAAPVPDNGLFQGKARPKVEVN